jgi:UDP-2,3-diacylglucosamine hydrolase
MALYAVSDTHIWGTDDPLYRSLLRLLSERVREGDTLVLAGDLFDLFVGNKRVFLQRYREFFAELEAAGRRGVTIHYIEGNHDFHLRRAFARIPRFVLHSRDFELELGGRRFYFSHGDLVDRKDYGYRALRIFFRSPLMRLAVALMPDSMVEWIGRGSARASKGARYRLPTQLPPGRMEYLRNTYRSYAAERLARGADFVVMGHCHDLDEKSFVIGSRKGQYVNVGFPRVHGSFLSWSPGEELIQREKLPEP